MQERERAVIMHRHRCFNFHKEALERSAGSQCTPTGEGETEGPQGSKAPQAVAFVLFE